MRWNVEDWTAAACGFVLSNAAAGLAARHTHSTHTLLHTAHNTDMIQPHRHYYNTHFAAASATSIALSPAHSASSSLPLILCHRALKSRLYHPIFSLFLASFTARFL